MTDPRQPHASADDRDHAAVSQTEPFGDLDRRPVAEHVTIFEAEHARLQDELSTIDQL